MSPVSCERDLHCRNNMNNLKGSVSKTQTRIGKASSLAAFTCSWRASLSSWGGGQPECWVALLPERWSHLPAACWAPRRCAPPAGGVAGWSWSSYCPWLHYPPAPGSQRLSTPTQPPDTPELRRRRAPHSCLCGGAGGRDPRGTAGRRAMSGTWPSHGLFLRFFLYQTCYSRLITTTAACPNIKLSALRNLENQTALKSYSFSDWWKGNEIHKPIGFHIPGIRKRSLTNYPIVKKQPRTDICIAKV